MQDRERCGIATTWWYDTDPETGERRPAYTPIEDRQLGRIEDRGIRHGDRYLATYQIKEVRRDGTRRREMWFVEASPVRRAAR